MSKELKETLLDVTIEVPEKTNGFVYIVGKIDVGGLYSYNRNIATAWNVDSTLEPVVEMVNLYNISKGYDVTLNAEKIRAQINIEKAKTALEKLEKAKAELDNLQPA